MYDFVSVTQVEYTYPAHTNISNGAKDLVSRLLKHNPMQRLPVQGVLAHPWVVERSTKKPTTMTIEQPSKWVFQSFFYARPPPCEGVVLQNTGWCSAGRPLQIFLALATTRLHFPLFPTIILSHQVNFFFFFKSSHIFSDLQFFVNISMSLLNYKWFIDVYGIAITWNKTLSLIEYATLDLSSL